MIRFQDFRTEIRPLVKSSFQKLFDIREGEESRVGLMFLYIFFTISTLLIIKPVSFSLFLSRFGASQLPFAFILVSISAVGLSFLYARTLKKENLNIIVGRDARKSGEMVNPYLGSVVQDSAFGLHDDLFKRGIFEFS